MSERQENGDCKRDLIWWGKRRMMMAAKIQDDEDGSSRDAGGQDQAHWTENS